MKKNQLSVTNFLYCGDEYLFIHRASGRKIDGGKLNGIGGKVEEGEDYLSAAVRETKEETGFIITPHDIFLSGVIHLHGGYEDDWTMCFFKISVPTKDVPLGFEISEGKLLWLPKDKVLNSGYELVDDLRIVWDKIVAENEIFFMDATVDENEKITTFSLRSLPR